MKSILIFLIIICWSLTIKAQDNKTALAAMPKVEKPVYSPDLTKVHDLLLKNFSVQEINDYLVFEYRGQSLDQATDLSAKMATDIKTNAKKVITAINTRFLELLTEDKAKWEADTLAKSKVKSIK